MTCVHPFDSPVSSSFVRKLFHGHLSIEVSHLMFWLGGMTIRYKAAWPYRKPPQIQLKLVCHQLQWFFKAVQITPNAVQVTEIQEVTELLSRIEVHYPNQTVLMHLTNDQDSQWFFLEKRMGHWCIWDEANGIYKALEQAIGQSRKIFIVWFSKSVLNSFSEAKVMQSALQLQSAHLVDPIGPKHHIHQWLLALRRPSPRLSWLRLLKDPKDYFWVAVQLGSQLRGSHSMRFDGHRLAFANALVRAGDLLNMPLLSRLALEFRRSADCWQIIQDIMLMGPSLALKQARSLLFDGTEIHHPSFCALAERFSIEGGVHDIPFRLRAIDKQLKSILHIESSAAEQIAEALAPLNGLNTTSNAECAPIGCQSLGTSVLIQSNVPHH